MPTKFRIVYTVIDPLQCRTLDSARKIIDSQSDDVAEFCDSALSRDSVTVRLQQKVKGASGWEWENVV